MPRLFVLLGLTCAFCQGQMHANTEVAGIRYAHFEILCSQYTAAVAARDGQPTLATGAEPAREQPSNLQLCCEFLPKFLALAQEDPSDDTALGCCAWVIAHCRGSFGKNSDMYRAECVAWELIGKYQVTSPQFPLLCLAAAKYPNPAREQFLRSLPRDYRQPVEVHGVAYLALADLLAKKYEIMTSKEQLREQLATAARDYFAATDPEQLRSESRELYEHVLAHYAAFPVAGGMIGADEGTTLGERAARHLRMLAYMPDHAEMSADRSPKLKRPTALLTGN